MATSLGVGMPRGSTLLSLGSSGLHRLSGQRGTVAISRGPGDSSRADSVQLAVAPNLGSQMRGGKTHSRLRLKHPGLGAATRPMGKRQRPMSSLLVQEQSTRFRTLKRTDDYDNSITYMHRPSVHTNNISFDSHS